MKKKQRMVDNNGIQCRTYIKIILAAGIQKDSKLSMLVVNGIATDIRPSFQIMTTAGNFMVGTYKSKFHAKSPFAFTALL